MDTLGEIGKQGLLGILLAGSLGVNFYLFRAYIAEKDKRLADQVQSKQDAITARDTIADPLNIIKENTVLIYEKLKAEKER